MTCLSKDDRHCSCVRFPWFLVHLRLVLSAGTVRAADYCVGTVQQRVSVRASAATDGEDSVVKLRAGSVAVTGDLVYTHRRGTGRVGWQTDAAWS